MTLQKKATVFLWFFLGAVACSNSYPCGWISEWFIITDFPSILNYWPSMTYLLTYLTYIPIYPASHTFKKLVTLVTRIDLTYWIKVGSKRDECFFWIWGMEDCGQLLVHWRWPVFLPVRRLHKRNGAAPARQDLQFLNKRTSFSKTRGSSQAGVFTPTGAYWTTEAKQAPPPQPPPFNNFPPAWDQANNRDMMTMIHWSIDILTSRQWLWLWQW